MRGMIEGKEARARARSLWAQQHVPGYLMGEVSPLVPLISREKDLVVIDVGANKGFYSKAFLTCFGTKVKHIYMLDPSPINFQELTNKSDSLIFDAADHDVVSAYHVAAGATAETGTLYTDEDGSPMASLYPHELSSRDGALIMGDDSGALRAVDLHNKIPVAITTVDLFMKEHAIAHVDVLKIDTEGYEMQVLLGARESLSAGLIDVILFEFGNHQVEARNFFVDFYKFFKSHNFKLYNLEHGKLDAIERYSYRFENFSGTFTFVASRAAARAHVPATFSEAGYLARNPDVRQAVQGGAFASGLQHWEAYGRFEGRRWE